MTAIDCSIIHAVQPWTSPAWRELGIASSAVQVLCPCPAHTTSPTHHRYTRNLDTREVAALMLLERCRCTRPMLHLPPTQQLDALQPRVAMALHHSVAVVSAFAPLTISAEECLLEGGPPPTVAHDAPRRLVGLARAYGDTSTVATMADVVVCSSLAGSAVAGTLVKLLCERVRVGGDPIVCPAVSSAPL